MWGRKLFRKNLDHRRQPSSSSRSWVLSWGEDLRESVNKGWMWVVVSTRLVAETYVGKYTTCSPERNASVFILCEEMRERAADEPSVKVTPCNNLSNSSSFLTANWICLGLILCFLLSLSQSITNARSQFAIRKWRLIELEWELTEQRFQLIRVLQQSSIPIQQRDRLSDNPASVRMQWSWRIELSLTWWTRSDTLSKTTFAKMTFDTSYWESKSSSSCTSKRAGKLRSQLELRKGVTTMMILFSKSIPFLPSLFRDVESVDQRYCRV